MPANRGLFDRLRSSDAQDARSVHQNTEDIEESIREHLKRMLNVRHGEAQAVPDFGIPALETQNINASEDMRRAMEESIRKYEPRLEAVKVRYQVPDEHSPLTVRYEIEARLSTKDESVRVRFESEADATGAWRVQG